MPARFTVHGVDGVAAQLINLVPAIQRRAAVALAEEADLIATIAAIKYVPGDTGALRRSVVVDDPETGPKFIRVTISFGDGLRYGVAVHEHEPRGGSPYDPPSWRAKVSRGGTIDWTIAGTGPQFLKIPIDLAKKGMLFRIARRIRL